MVSALYFFLDRFWSMYCFSLICHGLFLEYIENCMLKLFHIGNLLCGQTSSLPHGHQSWHAGSRAVPAAGTSIGKLPCDRNYPVHSLNSSLWKMSCVCVAGCIQLLHETKQFGAHVNQCICQSGEQLVARDCKQSST